MMKPVAKRVFGVLVFALILTAFGGFSFAQEQPAEPQGIPEEEIDVPIAVGEITVTAQKREENIQDVPVAVSVVTAEDLNIITAAGADVRVLSGRVPSLIMESSFGRAFPRFYIRGLGNTDFDLNASQPVSMVVDEVVLENPVVKGMPLFDLDRVEVLRGPQGTLFGRNTPAGIVKFDTVKPSKDFDAFVRASYGTYSTTDIQAAVGGSLGGDWSARFSGLYQGRNDWVTNDYEGGDDLGGYQTTAYRLQLLWQPNEKFSGLFKVHGWEVSDGTARIFRANIIESGTDELVSGFQQDHASLDGLNNQEIKALGGLLRLEYDFGGSTLTSITGYENIRDMYSRGDIDGGYGAAFLGEGNYGPGFIPFPSESAGAMPSLDQWTQEFRLASNGNEVLNWLVGFFYFNEEVNIDNYSYDTLAPGQPQNALASQYQKTDDYAFFGSLNWRLSEKWDLAGGLRYSNDEKDFWVDFVQPLFQDPLDEPITRNVGDSFVSWDVSATYKANQNVNVYGRVATGYRAPAIQGRITFCPVAEQCVTTADTEKNLSAEIGVKSILAENKLRLNLTGYIFEMSDQQLTAVGGEFNAATLLNADKTKGHGLEADIEWIPSGNWIMTFGASWNPTEIVDENLTVAPCGGGCTVTDPVIDGLAYINGNTLPHAPEYIFNGIINFRSDPVKKSFFGSLDWTYQSEKHFFLYDSVEFNSDAFELGMRLGYAWHKAMYEVAIFGRNILDAEIVRNGIDFNNLTGMMNDPRIIGVEFVAKF